MNNNIIMDTLEILINDFIDQCKISKVKYNNEYCKCEIDIVKNNIDKTKDHINYLYNKINSKIYLMDNEELYIFNTLSELMKPEIWMNKLINQYQLKYKINTKKILNTNVLYGFNNILLWNNIIMEEQYNFPYKTNNVEFTIIHLAYLFNIMYKDIIQETYNYIRNIFNEYDYENVNIWDEKYIYEKYNELNYCEDELFYIYYGLYCIRIIKVYYEWSNIGMYDNIDNEMINYINDNYYLSEIYRNFGEIIYGCPLSEDRSK